MDRRGLFFLVAAALCAVLIPVADADLRYVPEWLTAIYVVLAAASFLDDAGRKRTARRGHGRS